MTICPIATTVKSQAAAKFRTAEQNNGDFTHTSKTASYQGYGDPCHHLEEVIRE